MNPTSDFINALIAKGWKRLPSGAMQCPLPKTGLRADPFQERQAPGKDPQPERKVALDHLHPARSSQRNEKNYRHFSISITCRMANNRVIDPDGVLSTIMDCLVRARVIHDDRWTIIGKETIEFVRTETESTTITLTEVFE